jgi:hypothetical protein
MYFLAWFWVLLNRGSEATETGLVGVASPDEAVVRS